MDFINKVDVHIQNKLELIKKRKYFLTNIQQHMLVTPKIITKRNDKTEFFGKKVKNEISKIDLLK